MPTEVVEETRLSIVLAARVSYRIHQEGSEDELWLESNSIVPGNFISVTEFESRCLLASFYNPSHGIRSAVAIRRPIKTVPSKPPVLLRILPRNSRCTDRLRLQRSSCGAPR